MVITRTPFRISFFGGGTDYPEWYLNHGGSVLSSTIDKYAYISCRYLPPFFENRHRLVYSKIENCQNPNQIQHPGIRECIKFLNYSSKGLEIIHQGDMPARSGMGSSSAFIVGLLNGLYSLRGFYKNKHELFKEAIHVEQSLMKENVGSQDQAATAVGGVNLIEFTKNNEIKVNPIPLCEKRVKKLNNNLHLFFTGFQRDATNIVSSFKGKLNAKSRQLRLLKEFVNEGIDILCSNGSLDDFGKLLHESWLIKQTISEAISNNHVENIYTKAIEAGALGGKLLGAGGGGFMLLYINENNKAQVKEALKDLIEVPFAFDFDGSKGIYHTPTTVSEEINHQNEFSAFKGKFEEFSSVLG